MKAVIVDLQEEKAAALCEDGSVREIADTGYVPGQTIEVPDHVSRAVDGPAEEKNTLPSGLAGHKGRRSRQYFRQIAAAAAACFLVAGFGAGTVWAMPYGKVYMESGSSLAYTINRFDYVLEVEADNESGEELLEELDLKKIVHRKIDSAVEQTLEQIEQSEVQKESNAASEAGEDKVEIVTEVKNEKHAKELKERLIKITEAAADSPSVHDKEEINAEKPEDADSPEGQKPDAQAPDNASGNVSAPEGREEVPDAEKQGGSSCEDHSAAQDSSNTREKELSEQEKEYTDNPGFQNQAPDSASDMAPSGSAPGNDASDTSGYHPPLPADAPSPGSERQQNGEKSAGGPF